MPAKRTLAERAKWKLKNGRHSTMIGNVRIDVSESVIVDGEWLLYTCGTLDLPTIAFVAPNLTAAKARAIELVQERIRELHAAWEC